MNCDVVHKGGETVKDGRLAAGGFAEYPIFTKVEVPEIETLILETPDGEPSGTGEPLIDLVAPAIGNALFALTGVPMISERVRLAMRGKQSEIKTD